MDVCLPEPRVLNTQVLLTGNWGQYSIQWLQNFGPVPARLEQQPCLVTHAPLTDGWLVRLAFDGKIPRLAIWDLV